MTGVRNMMMFRPETTMVVTSRAITPTEASTKPSPIPTIMIGAMRKGYRITHGEGA